MPIALHATRRDQTKLKQNYSLSATQTVDSFAENIAFALHKSNSTAKFSGCLEQYIGALKESAIAVFKFYIKSTRPYKDGWIFL